jgi:hypothetical protein
MLPANARLRLDWLGPALKGGTAGLTLPDYQRDRLQTISAPTRGQAKFP